MSKNLIFSLNSVNNILVITFFIDLLQQENSLEDLQINIDILLYPQKDYLNYLPSVKNNKYNKYNE